ncbi:Extracellular sulfatase Sulf-2 [Bulinus truncatus]|nr:Extracellular sulfatase Sulf-2 [Bulinus truncatus]
MHIYLLVAIVIAGQVNAAHNEEQELIRERKISLKGNKFNTQPKDIHVKQTLEIFSKLSSSMPSTARSPLRPSSAKSQSSSRKKSGHRSDKPNIIVILTDDQDVLLGSLKYMPKVQNLLIRQGVYFNNSFVSTPMCCPSRSTFLTGLYPHNHNIFSNNYNCSSTEWQKVHEPKVFSNYINDTYLTGYFGKYLNEYDGSHTPPGWQRWVGLIKNSRFYNYSIVDENGVKTRHHDNYYSDYLTDLMSNESRAFIHDSKKKFPSKPLMMVVSVPAPHGPEDAAPQYQHMFVNNTDHRTPSWNYAPNPDKQWLLQYIYPMTPQLKEFTDLLQRRRLQTLQSVDDLVENIVEELDFQGELDNTYIIYTSDHGYHLGQFGLIKGKAMAFDFDTKVPLIVRGPGIRPGTIISNIISNVDIAPTVIDMAKAEVPEHMDGDSFMKLIRAAQDPLKVDKRGFVNIPNKPWRDTVLIERGKVTEKMMKQKMMTEELTLINQPVSSKRIHYYIPSRSRTVSLECHRKENQLPCKHQQKWYCLEEHGQFSKHRCRTATNSSKSLNNSELETVLKDQPIKTQPCPCLPKQNKKLLKMEKQKQTNKRHTHHKGRLKLKRHVHNSGSPRGFEDDNLKMKKSDHNNGSSMQTTSMSGRQNSFEPILNRRCRILDNQSVICDLDIYKMPSEWESHKETIDIMIKEYRKVLEDLKDIRKQLREQKPVEVVDNTKDAETEEEIVVEDDEMCECDENGNIVATKKKKRIEGKIISHGNRTLTREEKQRNRRLRRKQKTSSCNLESMNCFTHDNDHWKTPPYWTSGPFCFCANSNNNTYWCLRTINQTHDFLYCEFITTFMNFYDTRRDPHQLKNIVTELNYGVLQQLHEELKKLKHCKSNKDCYLSSSQKNRLPHDPQWPGQQYLSSQKKHVTQKQQDHLAKKDLEDFNYDDEMYSEEMDDGDGSIAIEQPDFDY